MSERIDNSRIGNDARPASVKRFMAPAPATTSSARGIEGKGIRKADGPGNPAHRKARPKLTEGRLRSLRLAWHRDRLAVLTGEHRFREYCCERAIKHPRKEARRLLGQHGLEALLGNRP